MAFSRHPQVVSWLLTKLQISDNQGLLWLDDMLQGRPFAAASLPSAALFCFCLRLLTRLLLAGFRVALSISSCPTLLFSFTPSLSMSISSFSVFLCALTYRHLICIPFQPPRYTGLVCRLMVQACQQGHAASARLLGRAMTKRTWQANPGQFFCAAVESDQLEVRSGWKKCLPVW